ncbi:YkgJ family cysteine cluster protein [Halalkalibacter flavus]|uniref:YkgJ family cysteine cluster protein n=1 Tax=Halalkalibacter flavus TaxID=3090668 RepID=UPI002FCAD3D8
MVKSKKKCHEDIQSLSAFAELIQLQQEIDNKVKAEKGNILCQKGCGSCCYEPFSISRVEFHYIIDRIKEEYGSEKVDEIIQKGVTIWEEIQKKHPDFTRDLEKDFGSKTLTDGRTKISGVLSLNNKAESIKIPCPFLDEQSQSCTIYEYRPIVCRSHGVGYLIEIENPLFLCEHMPNALDYREEMVNLTEFRERSEGFTNVFVKEYQQMLMDRPYPIFYSITILQKYGDDMENTTREFKNYSYSKSMKMKLDKKLKQL